MRASLIIVYSQENFVCFHKHHCGLIRYFNLGAAALILLMEANRGQNGIQALLAAEQEAQHIVNAAKAGNSSLVFKF
jgi:hypothetical protein